MKQKFTLPFIHDPSATAAFAALDDVDIKPVVKRDCKAVVIGGGTGAPVSIRTLLSMGIATDAVVSMADDGGSTGILREEADATAPGDVRKCITAMSADPEDPLTKAFKTRFTFAENHTLGNLMLSSLEAASGSFSEAIAICENMLNARGHVYPSTLNRVSLIAHTRDDRIIEGQAVACHSRTALDAIKLQADQPICAFRPALDAIKAADFIILGPGSLYTSIIPNLVVPGIIDAIKQSKAKVVFVCSLADMQGETWGMSAIQYWEALNKHGMEGLIDTMLIHVPDKENVPCDSDLSNEDTDETDRDRVRLVKVTPQDIKTIEASGTRVIARDLVDEQHQTWHDPKKLQNAFLEVCKDCRLQLK